MIAVSLPLNELGRLASGSKRWKNVFSRPELWNSIADQYAHKLGIAWKDVGPKEEGP